MAAPSWGSSAPPSLVWSPTTSSGIYNFGTLEAGETKSETFKLTNAGGKASGALTITLPGSAALSITSNECTGRSLGPKKSCSVSVRYTPTSSGESDSASLTATGVHAKASIKLEGKTEGSPKLAWSGTSGYGTVPAGNTTKETFTLANSGSGTSASLTTSLTNSTGKGFSITSDGCTGKSLAPGASCEVEVAYSSAKNGESDAATLAAGGAELGLSGEGGLQALTLSATTSGGNGETFTEGSRGANGEKTYTYDFARTGAEPRSSTFTITNEGVGTSEGLKVGTPGRSEVTLSNNKCEGTMLASGKSCTFESTYTTPFECQPKLLMTSLDVIGEGPDTVGFVHLNLEGSCS
jgi:hypothetical protein